MTIYSLDGVSEWNGHWFLPGKESDKKAGLLKFSRDTFTLELAETFEGGSVVELGVQRLMDVIHGISDKGDAITLLGSSSFGPRINFGPAGLVRPESIRPRFAIVGAYIDDPNATFKSIRVRVPGLLAWRGISAIEHSIEFDSTGKRLESMAYRIRPVPTSSVYLGNLPGEISFLVEIQTRGNQFGAMEIANDGWLRIQPETPKSIDWYLQSLHHILSFVGLLAGPSIHADAILLELEPRYDCTLLFRSTRIQLCNLSVPDDFFIPASKLAGQFPHLLDAWLALMPAVSTVNDLLQSILASDSLWLHVEFLSLMHVLEGMHRATKEGLYMSTDEYESVRAILSNAIPVMVKQDHRESLKSRIKYGNQVSLAKRLAEMANTLPVSLRRKVLGTESGVPRRWVDTRNYYTHWDEELRPNVLDGASLYYANTRLRMFARTLFLKMLAVDDQLIEQALAGSNKWAQEIIQFGVRESEGE